jgi:hypothetical protein
MAMQATKSRQTQEVQRMSNDKFISEVVNVGDLLRRNQVSANKGNENANVKRVDEAYRQFTEEIKDQREFMKTASEEQKEVFREVIEEFMKLRKDGKFDFERSHKEFQAAVSRINEVEGSEAAKSQIEKIAAIGMQHTDSNRPKGGAISQEIGYRFDKMFGATKADMESPLFRRLAGIDRRNHDNMITPMREMQNLGQAEAIKNRLGEDIMGEQQHDHQDDRTDEKLVAKIAAAMSSQQAAGVGKFPEKIENLHVERLIVKMVERAHDESVEKKAPFYVAPTLPPGSAGRSAVPVGSPMLPPPSGASVAAKVAPVLPAPSGEKVTPKQIEHQEGNFLPVMEVKPREPQTGLVRVKPVVRRTRLDEVNDAEDVDFREIEHPKEHKVHVKALPAPEVKSVEPVRSEPPIKIKGNPNNPLRTQESPMASAVRGAVATGFALPIAATPTVADAFTKADKLVDNDVGPRSADATRKFDDGDVSGKDGDGFDPTSLIPIAAEVLGGREKKGKGEEKEKAKSGEEKTKGAAEEKTKVKGKGAATAAEGLEAEGKGLARGATKVLKGVGKVGAIAGVVGAGITAYDAYNDVNAIDAAVKAGKMTPEQAKAAKAKTVGGAGGSIAGGLAGAEAGGLAGAALGTMILPGVGTVAGGLIGAGIGAFGGSELGQKAGEYLGGMWGTSDKNESGKIVAKASQDHQQAVKQEAKAPVIVHAPTTNIQSGGGSGNDMKVLPISGSPRSRESYFDRAMMGTFVM